MSRPVRPRLDRVRVRVRVRVRIRVRDRVRVGVRVIRVRVSLQQFLSSSLAHSHQLPGR